MFSSEADVATITATRQSSGLQEWAASVTGHASFWLVVLQCRILTVGP